MKTLHSSPRLRVLAFGLLAAGLLLLAISSRASAADQLYWPNYKGNKISFANLSGGGGGDLDTTGADATGANGLAIDAAAGKVYWIQAEPIRVFYANLSGGGGGELSIGTASPGFGIGLAIDPAGGRVYWANPNASKISFANLNGTGGGDLDTTGATVNGPTGVAVDPTGGRVYWANGTLGGPLIAYASLSGGGGGAVDTTGSTSTAAFGLAIDRAAGRVYWADNGLDKIAYAALGGGGTGDLNIAGAEANDVYGMALDPQAGRAYWVDEKLDKAFRANLDGSGGGAALDTGAANVDAPAFPAILKAPSPATPPSATGGGKPGSTLSCAPGTWAPDLLESFLYRVPRSTSIQWLQNGQPVAGATAGALAATSVGNYSCQSIAVNHAGSTTQTSGTVPIFGLAKKAKANKKKGTASISVQVPGAGKLTLIGKQLVKQVRTRSVPSLGTVKLLVKAKGKAKKKLAKKGKLKVKATIVFAPEGGSPAGQTKSVTLKQKLTG